MPAEYIGPDGKVHIAPDATMSAAPLVITDDDCHFYRQKGYPDARCPRLVALRAEADAKTTELARLRDALDWVENDYCYHHLSNDTRRAVQQAIEEETPNAGKAVADRSR